MTKLINTEDRINILSKLGQHLLQKDEFLEALMHRSMHHNGWFTLENQKQASDAISQAFLEASMLNEWVNKYKIGEPDAPKRVGIIMAGNIPLVGFHDLLAVFASGHKAVIKLSDKDQFVLPYLLKLMGNIDERVNDYFELTLDKLKNFEAVIATGSNNTARYFEYYFSKYPNIIRKNRNGVAILTGRKVKKNCLN
ncbi:MAG: hypothetical protein AAFO07_01880 [Bacteroidota bacterium]